MTESAYVPVDVPPEQVRVGDLFVDEDGRSEAVESVIVDAVPEFVYAFTPEQRPLRRGQLVRVHRPATDPAPPPIVAVTEQLAEVRDLALALADLAAKATPETVDRVAKGRDTVRARLEETAPDGTDAPAESPVLGQPPAPPGPAPAVQPAGGAVTPAPTGTAPTPHPGGTRRDR